MTSQCQVTGQAAWLIPSLLQLSSLDPPPLFIYSHLKQRWFFSSSSPPWTLATSAPRSWWWWRTSSMSSSRRSVKSWQSPLAPSWARWPSCPWRRTRRSCWDQVCASRGQGGSDRQYVRGDEGGQWVLQQGPWSSSTRRWWWSPGSCQIFLLAQGSEKEESNEEVKYTIKDIPEKTVKTDNICRYCRW